MCPHQSAVHCQVSLVSRDEELCGLQSSVTACAVTRGHTTTSVITTARAAEIAAEWRDVAELSKHAQPRHKLGCARRCNVRG